MSSTAFCWSPFTPKRYLEAPGASDAKRPASAFQSTPGVLRINS
eukprot:CAMPEP_0203948832 /NCGR_PEP_ID=MMETSP0359-20131031/83393_1 /ASSEMBLY_ACC=CAM_ASM_000338 /TAXON_ID=268821 /ORGANISM="Scrippsiella Hangoei, Strain SHTV-5" /LENGTH=43 /DNA_ID= /DNA_START= /DNA_END= /DNA_ORIENTATION=